MNARHLASCCARSRFVPSVNSPHGTWLVEFNTLGMLETSRVATKEASCGMPFAQWNHTTLCALLGTTVTVFCKEDDWWRSVRENLMTCSGCSSANYHTWRKGNLILQTEVREWLTTANNCLDNCLHGSSPQNVQASPHTIKPGAQRTPQLGASCGVAPGMLLASLHVGEVAVEVQRRQQLLQVRRPRVRLHVQAQTRHQDAQEVLTVQQHSTGRR